MAEFIMMEKYPLWIPLASIAQTLAIYSIGAVLLTGFGLIPVLLYLLFCVWAEFRVLSMSCRYCYYYGKLCGTGKGMIAPLFFKKGDPQAFLDKAIGLKELIPDFLVFLVPVVAGIVHLFIRFSFIRLGLIVIIVLLALPLSGYMRTCYLCANCKQRELGCPASEYFSKGQKGGK